MSIEEKAQQIFQLVADKTYPKDQIGFYTEENLYQDILNIVRQ